MNEYHHPTDSIKTLDELNAFCATVNRDSLLKKMATLYYLDPYKRILPTLAGQKIQVPC